MLRLSRSLVALLLSTAATVNLASAAAISGELKTWHRVTLTFAGPTVGERDAFNPFLHYRLNVTFRHVASGRTYLVPGYFAADGRAAETSAEQGDVWRAHFAPDATGEWTWSAQFRKGRFVAVSAAPLGGAPGGFMDGEHGSFTVTATDKTGRDFRARGRLEYAGGHYPRFAGTGEYFLKEGTDAPENLLSYADFDGTFSHDGHKDNLVKTWAPHLRDWRKGDPTWQGGKGKGILGALNYLASKGLNAVSMLTMNIEGDDQNVFPFVDYDTYDRYDVSKLDQWEIVFEHAQELGLFLHFKLTESEGQGLLDHGGVGVNQMAYYREMVARFGHHLALNWNLGEENGEWLPDHQTPPMSPEARRTMVAWFRRHDPYHHLVVVHNGASFDDLLGPAVAMSGVSLQIDPAHCHEFVRTWREASEAAGYPWLVANDEQGPANTALPPDDIEPDHRTSRQGALWGALLAGAWGNEWYFGYKYPHSDLTCQDWRTRDRFWDQARYALEFFQRNQIPFWEMQPATELLSGREGYCFALPGDTYVIYLKPGSAAAVLDLGRAPGLYSGLGRERFSGTYEVRWFDPRHGGDLQSGTIATLTNGEPARGDNAAADHNPNHPLGQAPDTPDQDWVVLVRKTPPAR